MTTPRKPTRSDLLARLERLETELKEAEANYDAARKKAAPYQERATQAGRRVDSLTGQIADTRTLLIEAIEGAA